MYGDYPMKRPFLAAGLAAFVAVAVREWLFCDRAFDLPFVIAAVFFLAVFILCAVVFKKRRVFFITAAFVLAAAVACLTVWTFSDIHNENAGKDFSGTSVECEIKITSEPVITSNGYYRYIGKAVSPEELKGTGIIFYGFEEENISLGSRVSGKFTLEIPEDRNYYYRYNGIVLFASRGYDGSYTVTEPDGVDLYFLTGKLKSATERVVNRLFGDRSDIILGFLLGDTDGLSPEVKNSFRVSGISHLLAVSGLHISVISLFILTLFSKSKKKWLPYFAATVFIILTAALSGFSPSVCRAVIMQLLLFAGKLCCRNADTKNIFGFALFILILVNPFIVSSPSFLLSFAATGAVIFAYPPVYSRMVTGLFKTFSVIPGRFFEKLLQTVTVSFLCTLFTFPVTYICFGTASFLGIISNVFVYPFVFVTFVTAFAAVVIGFIPGFYFTAVPLAYISKIGASLIMYIAGKVSMLSGTASEITLDMGFVSDYWILLSVVALIAAAGFLWLLFSKKPKMKKKTRGTYLRLTAAVFIVVVSSLCIFFFTGKSEEKAVAGTDINASFIDVGQGNSVVITQGGRAFVYDCGGTLKPGDRCAEYLLGAGYEKIDAVIISYTHSDHINGLKKLLNKIPADEVIIPYTATGDTDTEELKTFLDKQGTKLTVLYEDTETELSDGAKFSLLVKHFDEEADENDNSIVLSLDYYDTDLLLCGDLSKVGEKKLIKAYPTLDTDIFGVGHHGSKYSACAEFLESITPEISVISVAEKNSYGHPDSATVSRLEEYGAVYITKDSGNITLTLNGEIFTVKTEK